MDKAEVTNSNYNLADLCYVCLHEKELEEYLDLTTIYDEDDNLTYGECFTIITQINLSENLAMPHNLCKSCGLELQMSYDFYKKIEESKRYLQQYQQEIIAHDGYEPDENDAKHTEDAEIATHQSEEIVLNSSQFEVTDQIADEVAQRCSFAETREDLQDVNVEQQFIAITKQEEDADIIDVDSFVRVDEERVTHVDECLVLEEHLEIDEFNTMEALDEEAETETLQIKSPRNTVQMELYKIEADDKYFLVEDTDNNNSQTTSTAETATSPKNQNKSKDFRSWQENVVAVANKEHLPLESENDGNRDDSSDLEYEVIPTATEDNESDVVCLERDDESMGDRSRKRHVGTYTCDYCLKVFPNYSRMMTHRRCHVTDRPKYPCGTCNRVYATKQAMECHIQTVHNKTGYTCSVCNKVFAIRRSLEVHMRFHNGEFPYACNLCDRKFAQLCHLNTHKNVKHNNVRFGCDYPSCGKFFTSSSSLRNHEFTHGIMPFECEYCQRGYPAKAKLKVHIKRKHDKEVSVEELENMRKFHVMRSKVNLVQVVSIEQEA